MKLYELEFILAGTPKATNALFRSKSWHVRAKNAAYWKMQVKLAVWDRKPHQPLERVEIAIIRRSYRTLDYDGLVASMKPVVDGLVEMGVLQNDGWKNTGIWFVTQEYAPKGREHVWVKIKERIPEEH